MTKLLPNTMNEGYYGRLFPADKMYIYVSGVVTGAGMYESMRALPYMREAHAGQFRSDGQRYEIHPLSMACYALSLRLIAQKRTEHGIVPVIDDATIATILLHDVPEEAGILVESMPFSDEVLHGVKYMTISERFPGETKFEQKRRYANELLEDPNAVICKAIDMCYNFSTMLPTFSGDKIRKNVVEADMLRMPVLKKAKQKYPDLRPLLWVLRENITALLHVYAMQYKVRLSDSNFVNPPDAKDYAFLITGENHEE